MKEIERQKLKALMDAGKSNEEILELMKPKGNGRVKHVIPEGGIGIRAAGRKYKVASTTISHWRRKGWLPTVLETPNTIFVDESSLAKLVVIYLPHAKRGTNVIKRELAAFRA